MAYLSHLLIIINNPSCDRRQLRPALQLAQDIRPSCSGLPQVGAWWLKKIVKTKSKKQSHK